jgi:ABC-type glycerol-3-phosphate transport system permease component
MMHSAVAAHQQKLIRNGFLGFLRYGFLAALGILFLIPFYWMVSTSFKSAACLSNSTCLIPDQFHRWVPAIWGSLSRSTLHRQHHFYHRYDGYCQWLPRHRGLRLCTFEIGGDGMSGL